MKNNKALVIVAILVILAGGAFGAGKYLENRVLNSLKEMVDGSDKVSVGSMSFSLMTRTAEVRDVKVAIKMGNNPIESKQSYARAEAVLPWSLILNPDAEGSILLAETYTIEDAKDVQGNLETTIARMHATNIVSDLSLSRKLLSEDGNSADWATLLERSSIDSLLAEQLVQKQGDMETSLKKIEVSGLKGLKMDAITVDGTIISGALEPGQPAKQIMTLDSFTVKKVDVPANVLRMVFDMEPAQLESPEVLQALVQTLFAGQNPLFGSMSINTFTVSENVFPLSIDTLDFEWFSMRPVQHASSMKGLTIPTDALEKEMGGVSFPGLKTIVIDSKTSLTGNESGMMEENAEYDVRDLATITMRTAMQTDPSSPSMPLTLWDETNLMSAAFTGIDLTINDKGLLSYVLWNMEGPEATGASVLAQLEALRGRNEEKNAVMIDSLTTFIKHPGTLTVRFKPENPVPLMGMMGVAFDPASNLEFSSTAGATSIEDAMKALRDKAAQK